MKAIARRSVVAVALAGLLSTAVPAADPVVSPPATATPAAAAKAAPGVLVLGAGSRPGLAVDDAGTGYVAWIGPGNPTTLEFCRLSRGASACSSRLSVAVPAGTTSSHRPFVTISPGGILQIVQYRNPLSGTNPAAVYVFTSPDLGSTFTATTIVGTVPFEEGVQGPGQTFSGVPVNGEMAFQNVPLHGGATTDKAVLSTTHQNHASVALTWGGGAPVAVSTHNNAAEWRQYDGSGNLNSIANWTSAADVGVASHPKLAGGPSGLFLLAGNGSTGLNVRRFNGSGFGASVPIGPGQSPSKHLAQDASGRLHAVFQRDDANPLRLIHAVSDDGGLRWRSGTLVTQRIVTDGGIHDLRVAAAPDHLGFAVWHAGLGAGDVRIAALGTDAPRLSFASSPNSLRVTNRGGFTYDFAVTAPGSGAISLKSTKRVRVGGNLRFLSVPAKRYTAALPGEVRVRLDLSDPNLRALKRVGSLLFKVTVTYNGTRYRTTLRLRAP